MLGYLVSNHKWLFMDGHYLKNKDDKKIDFYIENPMENLYNFDESNNISNVSKDSIGLISMNELETSEFDLPEQRIEASQKKST